MGRPVTHHNGGAADALISLRVPAVVKARWVRESRAAGMRLTDWLSSRVEQEEQKMAESKKSLARTKAVRKNFTELQKISEKLDHNQLLILLAAGDEVEVCRNTAGNLLPGSVETMTAEEAIQFGAWDSSHGTMDAVVSRNGLAVRLADGMAYVIVNTGDLPAWEADAAEPRETLTCWTYER